MVVRHLNPRELQELNRSRLLAKEAFEKSIADNRGAIQKAIWESKNEQTSAKRTMQEKMEAARKELEEELLSRRRRLADLYNFEMEAWHDEILSRVETTEDRKNKIREKAYALKARNEAARQAFVKECYDRRWRDACDDARLLDGKALLKYVSDYRLQQIDEKRKRIQDRKKEEEKFFDYIQIHVKKLEGIEKAKEDKKEHLKQDTIKTLEEQIQWAKERKERHLKMMAEEDEEEIRQIKEEMQMEQEKMEKLKRVAYERGREVRKFNEARLGMRQAKKEQERQQDLALLHYALLKEKEEEEAEKAKRDKAQHESLAYQNYLKELMIKEAEDTSAIEDIRKRQEESVWDKKDEVQRRQREARETLMKAVHEGRQEQLRLKQLASLEDKKLEDMQVAKWRSDIEKGLQDDRAKVEARRKQDQENVAFLRSQMEQKRRREQLEKQQEYLLIKHMEKEEADHVRRQKEQAGKVRLHYPLSTAKWYS